jgi:hypothetical protein
LTSTTVPLTNQMHIKPVRGIGSGSQIWTSIILSRQHFAVLHLVPEQENISRQQTLNRWVIISVIRYWIIVTRTCPRWVVVLSIYVSASYLFWRVGYLLREWMPLVSALARNMASAFWWRISANRGVAWRRLRFFGWVDLLYTLYSDTIEHVYHEPFGQVKWQPHPVYLILDK